MPPLPEAHLLALLRRRRALQRALANAQAAVTLLAGEAQFGPSAPVLAAPHGDNAALRAALMADIAAVRTALLRHRVALAQREPPAGPLARRERLVLRAERLLRRGCRGVTTGEMSVVAGDGFAPATLRGMVGSRTAALRRSRRA